MQQQQTDMYGHAVRKGVIFGYLCSGRTNTNLRVYRFGKTTKTLNLLDHDQCRFISKLGGAFAGLHKPRATILFERVSRLDQVWDILRDYLRRNVFVPEKTRTPRPPIVHAASFGDNFYILQQQRGAPEVPVEEIQMHLTEVWSQLLKLAC